MASALAASMVPRVRLPDITAEAPKTRMMKGEAVASVLRPASKKASRRPRASETLSSSVKRLAQRSTACCSTPSAFSVSMPDSICT